MKKRAALCLFWSLTLLLAACASEPSEIYLVPLDTQPAVEETFPPSETERSIAITARSGPAVPAVVAAPGAEQAESVEVDRAAPFSPASTEQTYILNTGSMKFHSPSCASVNDMKDANKQEFTGTRDAVIAMGYEPCGRCKP